MPGCTEVYIIDEIFSSEFFVGNRARLRQLFTGTAPIVVTANGLLQRGSDEAFPFAQDASFWYLTGIDEPGIVLVIDKGREYLIVPGRENVREVFDGAVDFDNMARRSGITEILNEKDGWRQLESRIKKVKYVATLAAKPKYVDFWGMYTNPARAELIKKLKHTNSELELLDVRPHMSRMRMIKQPAELQALQNAIDITIATIKEVTRPGKLAKYAHEYEIEADITRGFRRRGARGHGFMPIVASGKRGCTMHSAGNNGALASDELLIMDVSADFDHYVTDIARTVSLGGQPSRRQQTVYEAVLEAQAYAFSLLKPGVLMQEYEKQMEAFIGEKLRELSLIKTIERETVRQFFPHAASHFLGLDAHDAGDYERPLEPGVVLAVEPGIYIPHESLGVRIEDNVLITTDGVKVLTNRLPRELS
jgi:Xaa-Pro aminopeptidase